MTALDMARGRYYDKDIDALEAAPDESPPRPTMGATDHLGEQFGSVLPAGRRISATTPRPTIRAS